MNLGVLFLLYFFNLFSWRGEMTMNSELLWGIPTKSGRKESENYA